MFTSGLVFSLIHSFPRLTRILYPLTASQPIGNFRTLGKRVETIFMGLSGRRSLFPRVSPSRSPFFLVPTTSKCLLASYVFNFFWDGCNTQEKKKNKGYAKFWRANKVHYGRCASGVSRKASSNIHDRVKS